MAQASERPRRTRLSWESRCEIVAVIAQAVRPPAERGLHVDTRITRAPFTNPATASPRSRWVAGCSSDDWRAVTIGMAWTDR